MLIKGVDFPEELLRAQANGDLVVFAGAGVSQPPPSSLPLFSGLAAQIGNASGRQKEEHEPEDRYLGRLKKAGVQVHNAAARILVNERTKPTALHRHLLQLFPSGEKVRLVTTNFDVHFTTSAAELYQEKAEIFCAPALPLGDDFAGLVYLHGSAGKEPKRCVLTDEDFGRAYLTEAWASRFLAAMFSRYVVLFVGYSHNDTVMNYLARGLPPVTQKQRFAFTTSDEESLGKWEFLGIRPLVYQKSDEENAHSAISISVGEWVNELNRGLLEKAQRIRSIAEAHPPLAGEDADYIKFSLGEKSTWQLFFKYARLPEWISWLETHGFTKRVFESYAVINEFDQQLAFWLTEHYFVQYSSELMAAIQRNNTRIHPHLAWCIWRRLCIRDKEPVGDRFSRWVAVLLTQPRHVLRYDDWCSLLHHCRYPDDKLASLLLFEFVTKPSILLKAPWHTFDDKHGGDKVEFALNLSNDREHWLSEAWEHLFLPNLADYVVDLLPIVTANLGAAHSLLQICGRGRRDEDPFRWHRQSIEHPAEHGVEHTIDALVDAAKAILDHLLIQEPKQAAAVIAMWLRSDAAILRRFALYGFGQLPDVASDEKVHWLIENGFLYVFKADAFEFLKRCFATANEDTKRILLRHVLEGPKGDLYEHLEARTKDYEIYNYVVWLNRIAPLCEIARESYERLQREHSDFAPREDPELDFWSGGVQSINPTEGFNIDLIASKPAAEFLDEFLAWRPRDPMDRSGPSSVVAAVVTKNPNWGLEWVRVVLARGLSDSKFWYCVCQGWRNAALTPEQWAAILDAAETIEAPDAFFSAFAENLENGSRRERDRLPDELMERAQHVAERIWEHALKLTSPEAADQEDWLTVAINRPGGKLAEFWLQRISVARKFAGDSWKGLPPDVAASVSEMLRSSAGAAVHARIVFASQLHYFFHLDAAFAEREMLPLFDWQTDPLRAEQCWHGYLWWGRWLPGLTERLLPHFDETLNRLDKMPDDLRRHAVSHIAGLALFRFDNPFGSGWLMKTVAKLPESDLDHLTSEIDRLLDDATPAVAEKIWDRWLKDYWEMRLLGTPKPLSRKEATEMVHWSLSLGPRLPDALKLVQQMQGMVEFEHPDLLYRIEKKGIARSQPHATAVLLLFFFKSTPRHFYAGDHVEKVWSDLKAGGVLPDVLKRIREAMLALGHDPEQEPS